MALLHVSTAYVCGLREGFIAENDPIPANGFANGYEASKAAAERTVSESGLTYAIARPSIVTGDSRTGAMGHFDSAYMLFKLMARGLISRMPASDDASLDFVPIDHVAGAIASLAQDMKRASASGPYHLVSGQPVTMADFINSFAAYSQFRQPQFIDSDAFDARNLSPVERRIFRKVGSQYASYFQRHHVFDNANFRAFNGKQSPPTDAAYLRRLIDFCIAEGFLPAG